MLVKWNGKNVWSIGSGLNDSSVIQIIPGPNDLKPAEWDAIKNHPVVKARMEKDVIDEKRGKVKLLEVIIPKEKADGSKVETKGEDESGEGEGEGDKTFSLSSVSVKDAKGIIEETFNTELLREWQDADARSGVQKAIEKQFEKIEEARLADEEAAGTKNDAGLEQKN